MAAAVQAFCLQVGDALCPTAVVAQLVWQTCTLTAQRFVPQRIFVDHMLASPYHFNGNIPRTQRQSWASCRQQSRGRCERRMRASVCKEYRRSPPRAAPPWPRHRNARSTCVRWDQLTSFWINAHSHTVSLLLSCNCWQCDLAQAIVAPRICEVMGTCSRLQSAGRAVINGRRWKISPRAFVIPEPPLLVVS